MKLKIFFQNSLILDLKFEFRGPYFDFNVQLMLLKLFEQKNVLSNCSKQLVTQVNLNKKIDKLYNFQNWEQTPKAKNCIL
jgi:hypothetical protein